MLFVILFVLTFLMLNLLFFKGASDRACRGIYKGPRCAQIHAIAGLSNYGASIGEPRVGSFHNARSTSNVINIGVNLSIIEAQRRARAGKAPPEHEQGIIDPRSRASNPGNRYNGRVWGLHSHVEYAIQMG